MTSLRRRFLKNKISTDFSGIWGKDVIVMMDKAVQVLRLYLPPFSSYRENSGGAESASPAAPTPPPKAERGLMFEH